MKGDIAMSFQYNDRLVWPGGKKKAFTLSYDDGITQDKRLIELFNRYGVKGTFNLNPGLFGRKGTVAAGKKEVSHDKFEKSGIESVYAGHEVAGHGKVHCCMTGMDAARCIEEIAESRKGLEEIFHRPVTGFAYAFGAYDATVLGALADCGISYARTIENTKRFDIPENFLEWHPTCHHCEPQLMALADEFLSDDMYFSMKTSAKLFYVWGHSYEFDQDENWDMMERFLAKVAGRKDVWYATNGEICAYVNAFEKLIYTVDGNYVYNPTATTLYVGGIFGDDYIEVKPGKTAEVIPAVEM